ncbi:DUF6884 domain-containing protein [Halalkalicoccus sp. NIPERK01]|uniref:DUF6884 domain-containing protein n=1 Tax=Halalkalicoccus sp. NIPERK01 TaxID=3053469 RepID=UPI00256F2354|nr:DUF6884 domain-containing protein [Halalkalicoccus sp. NIPERK01]MDL5363884.1 hypothetical protein [Halalkalicoccus sp. NIPERK01]
MEIRLISCTKSKRDHPAQLKDLYMESPLFRKARAYAETHHDDWWILSAKHGLLAPDGPPIDPYDETLTTASKADQRTWAQQVASQLADKGLLTEATTLVFHAGRDYYAELLPLIEDTGVTVQIPTEGLQIGDTLAWYNEHQ